MRYKLNPWYDAAADKPAGFGIDVLYRGEWMHVINEKGDGPLLLADENVAHMRGKAIVERARKREAATAGPSKRPKYLFGVSRCGCVTAVIVDPTEEEVDEFTQSMSDSGRAALELPREEGMQRIQLPCPHKKENV